MNNIKMLTEGTFLETVSEKAFRFLFSLQSQLENESKERPKNPREFRSLLFDGP